MEPCSVDQIPSAIMTVGAFALMGFAFWASLQYLRWLHNALSPNGSKSNE